VSGLRANATHIVAPSIEVAEALARSESAWVMFPDLITNNNVLAPGRVSQLVWSLVARVPIVSPEWLVACYRQKQDVPVSQYLLSRVGASTPFGKQRSEFGTDALRIPGAVTAGMKRARQHQTLHVGAVRDQQIQIAVAAPDRQIVAANTTQPVATETRKIAVFAGSRDPAGDVVYQQLQTASQPSEIDFLQFYRQHNVSSNVNSASGKPAPLSSGGVVPAAMSDAKSASAGDFPDRMRRAASSDSTSRSIDKGEMSAIDANSALYRGASGSSLPAGRKPGLTSLTSMVIVEDTSASSSLIPKRALQGMFAGCVFLSYRLSAGDDFQLLRRISEHGGEFVSKLKTVTGRPVHYIVCGVAPRFRHLPIKFSVSASRLDSDRVAQLVTPRWIDACIKARKLVDIWSDISHLPTVLSDVAMGGASASSDDAELMQQSRVPSFTEVKASLSQFSASERSVFQAILLRTGASVTDAFRYVCCTICTLTLMFLLH